MVESPSTSSLGEAAAVEIEYRSVEPWAIYGLVLGIVSPVALLAPILWLVPPAGILANLVALRRIDLHANRVGRAAALAGLALCVLFGVMPIAKMATAYVLLRDQPREVADQFFEYLRDDRPEKALILRSMPAFRQLHEDDADPWLIYRINEDAKRDVTSFVNMPLVRALLALDGRAEVRYFKTVGMGTSGAKAEVNYWYTVTFDDDSGKKKTFLVGVLMERVPSNDPGLNPWRVKTFYDVDPRQSL